jgi:hypothetical protein
MDTLSASDFVGTWRTESACIQFRDDGTFETLHAPSRGKFQVIRDAEWFRWPVKSRTGFVLVAQFDLPGFGSFPGTLQLIDSLTASVAVIRVSRPEQEGQPITLRRDSVETGKC